MTIQRLVQTIKKGVNERKETRNEYKGQINRTTLRDSFDAKLECTVLREIENSP